MPDFNQLTIEELRERVHLGKCADPIVMLESVMNGYDIRKQSEIYELILEIDAVCVDGSPDKSQWSEIVEHVQKFNRYKSVTLDQSIKAATTVAEYLHSKRKSVEINSLSGEVVELPNINKKEIEHFKKVWNAGF